MIQNPAVDVEMWEMDLMETIPLYFLFVDLAGRLVRVEKDVYEFPDVDDDDYVVGGSVGDEEQIVPFSVMISAVKKWGGSRYKLADTLLFETGDLEEGGMADFVGEPDLEKLVVKHFKVLPFLNDVSFSPSLIGMQSLHGLYFVLKEKVIVGGGGGKPRLNFVADGLDEGVIVETKDFGVKMGTTRRNLKPLLKRMTRRHRK